MLADGSCPNLGPQAISKTLGEAILSLMALLMCFVRREVSVLPFWKFWSDTHERQTWSLPIRLSGKGTPTFHGAEGPLACLAALYCRAPAFCKCPQQGLCWDWGHCEHRNTAGTGGIACTGTLLGLVALQAPGRMKQEIYREKSAKQMLLCASIFGLYMHCLHLGFPLWIKELQPSPLCRAIPLIARFGRGSTSFAVSCEVLSD